MKKQELISLIGLLRDGKATDSDKVALLLFAVESIEKNIRGSLPDSEDIK